MTLLMPSCERVTALLMDYEDGALGPLDWLGLRLHLWICPPCRAFLGTYDRAPGVVRHAWDEAPTPGAEQAFCRAMTALREGRVPAGPQHHPEPEAWEALAPGGDPATALLLRVHLGHCAACRAERPDLGPGIAPGGDVLTALRPHLPPEPQWRWRGRGPHGRMAILVEDAATGMRLQLASLPGGQRVAVHDHLGCEQVVVLTGALQDGPAHLRPGDWISCQPGHRHGPAADPGAVCWALVHQERPVRFLGWRGWFRR